MSADNQVQTNIMAMTQSSNAGGNLTLSGIVFITDTNFKLLKPEWLQDEGLMLKLKGYFFEIIESGKTLEAMDCFDHLQRLLTQNSRIAKMRPDILMEYLRMLAVLKSTFLINLPEQDIETFFKENVLFCLEVQDLDFSEQIYHLLNLYRKDSKEFEEQRKQIQNALENNEEFLGEGEIVLQDEKQEHNMTVANWLEDYKQFSAVFSISSRSNLSKQPGRLLGGSLERVTYLQKNQNVKNLQRDEKTILFRLLELYDWIRTVKINSEFIPIFSSYYQIGNKMVAEYTSEAGEINQPLDATYEQVSQKPKFFPKARKAFLPGKFQKAHLPHPTPLLPPILRAKLLETESRWPGQREEI